MKWNMYLKISKADFVCNFVLKVLIRGKKANLYSLFNFNISAK